MPTLAGPLFWNMQLGLRATIKLTQTPSEINLALQILCHQLKNKGVHTQHTHILFHTDCLIQFLQVSR